MFYSQLDRCCNRSAVQAQGRQPGSVVRMSRQILAFGRTVWTQVGPERSGYGSVLASRPAGGICERCAAWGTLVACAHNPQPVGARVSRLGRGQRGRRGRCGPCEHGQSSASSGRWQFDVRGTLRWDHSIRCSIVLGWIWACRLHQHSVSNAKNGGLLDVAFPWTGRLAVGLDGSSS